MTELDRLRRAVRDGDLPGAVKRDRSDWRDNVALAILVALEVLVFVLAFRSHGIF